VESSSGYMCDAAREPSYHFANVRVVAERITRTGTRWPRPGYIRGPPRNMKRHFVPLHKKEI